MNKNRSQKPGPMRCSVFRYLFASACALFYPLLLAGCVQDRPITAPFLDVFDRPTLGSDYLNTGGPYQIKEGKLHVAGAYNHPLWLKRKLPANALIELDAMALSAEGDIKMEAWGDGQSHATRKGAYLATSYVFIQGGWGNSLSALCRMDEHASDRKVRKTPKVSANKVYHWKIRRQGNRIRWFVDEGLFLEMDDPSPLEGSRHAYLGFNNWKAPLVFDNLKITPL